MWFFPSWASTARSNHQSIGEPRSENAQNDIQKVQAIPQSTSPARNRSVSFGLEAMERLQRSLPDPIPRTMRAQSEELDTKKRKHFVVDIEELKMAAEERVLSARSVKTADKKLKEAESLVRSAILSPEQPVQIYKDKAKEERLAATRDAPRPRAQQREPSTPIREYRDEHEKRQQEAAAAHTRQLSQVNRILNANAMGKPRNFGPKPRSEFPDSAADSWTRPSANAHAGRPPSQMSQSTPQISNKRQRTETGSVRTSGSSRSPIEVDNDPSEEHRHSSAARSGHSQTLNEPTRYASSGVGGVGEYRNVHELTRVHGNNRRIRPNSSSHSHGNGVGLPLYKKPTIVRLDEKEDATDPISDSDIDGTNKSSYKKRAANFEIQVPSCPPITRTKDQTYDINGAGIHRGANPSSSSETPQVSQHFSRDGNENRESRASSVQQASKFASTPRIFQRKGHASGGFGDKSERQLESSPDQLLSQDQMVEEERKHFDCLQELLQQPNSPRERPIDLDDSDDDEPSKNADIEPTNFKTAPKGKLKSARTGEVYELRQVFSHAKLWLHGCNSTWTMKHDQEKKYLALFNEQGEREQPLLTSPFNAIHYSQKSAKVIVQRHRDHASSNATQLFMEFSSIPQCLGFTEHLVSACGLRAMVKSEEHLDKAFRKFFEDVKNGINLKPGDKRPRGEEQPDDVRLAIARSEKKVKNLLNTAQSKSYKTGDASIRHSSQEVEEPRPRKRRVTEAMRTDSIKADSDEDKRRTFQHHELPPLPPDTFYRRSSAVPDSSTSHGTRSSTRIASTDASQKTRAQRRPPSPEIPDSWTKLNPTWAKDVNWRSSIIYPPEGRSRATVDQQDIYRLDEGEFLNDNLVTFYLRWLEHQLKPEVAKRVYFQNSFFFEKLSKPAKGSKDGINYKAVEKWTAKVNIFEYDYIVVPVNENLHWYVAIICNAPKLLEAAEKAKHEIVSQDVTEGQSIEKTTEKSASPSSDSSLTPRTRGMTLADQPAKAPEPSKSIGEASPNQKLAAAPQSNGVEQRSVESSPPPITSDILPTDTKIDQAKKGKKKSAPPSRKSPDEFRIITLDSFHIGRSPCCTKLKRYLLQEMKTKLNIEADDPGPIGMTAKNIPHQTNSSDCGLFLLSYIEKFLQGPDEFIKDIFQSAVDLTDLSEKYPPASSMRERVRDLLFNLQQEQYGDDESKKAYEKLKSSAKSKKEVDANSSVQAIRKAQYGEDLIDADDRKQPHATGDKATDGKAKSDEDFLQASIRAQTVGSTTLEDNTLQPTPKQTGIINTIYTTMSGLLGRGRNTPESSSREQTGQSNSVIVIEASTQNSAHISLEALNGKSQEIVDSQEPSSQASSRSKGRSSRRNTTSPTEAIDFIEILDSPESKRSVPGSTLSTKANGTRRLKSPAPLPVESKNHGRGGRLAAYDCNRSGFPQVKQLGSPSPEPAEQSIAAERNSEVEGFGHDAPEDDVDLIPTFTIETDESHGKANGHNETEEDESEMLLPNDGPGTRNLPKDRLSSPTLTSTSRKSDIPPALVHQSTNDGSAHPSRGRKRKSLADEDEHSEHEQRRKQNFRTVSPDFTIIETKETKQHPKARDYEHKNNRGSRRGSVGRGNENVDTASLEKKLRKQRNVADEEERGGGARQRPSPSYHLDPSDAAVIGKRQKGIHTKFSP
ncbi:uncharacterized protein LY89DRAFT_50502 [Mollisia scopiformis]|uniref:Ubiquitin-like protease family profile domain-containing protein n=1 Tax=Mollisia scopiformis TaxID=149040 RepID=A0A194XAW1_MOLSC|nr:uncharacterized protein LY89DRAFT_50502 [Mollisia scopiformis]KUJ17311.1 hypothetical protein LY89DRAFT_50502 [Mollisia scopiformis]